MRIFCYLIATGSGSRKAKSMLARNTDSVYVRRLNFALDERAIHWKLPFKIFGQLIKARNAKTEKRRISVCISEKLFAKSKKIYMYSGRGKFMPQHFHELFLVLKIELGIYFFHNLQFSCPIIQKKWEISDLKISSAGNICLKKIRSFYTLFSAAAITAAMDNFVTFFLYIFMAKWSNYKRCKFHMGF